jgi:hypothetical protein
VCSCAVLRNLCGLLGRAVTDGWKEKSSWRDECSYILMTVKRVTIFDKLLVNVFCDEEEDGR